MWTRCGGPRRSKERCVNASSDKIDTLRALLAAAGGRRLVDLHGQACIHLLNARVERLEQLLAESCTYRSRADLKGHAAAHEYH